jgi:molybdopterin synthase catalytic subunit|tara:strand:+ start:407 stop:700 length:294 start_codon:yes stop_codon:yes gene_type:complete
MKITKVSLEEIMSSYDDPNLQQAAVAFVGALRNFDKTENDEYLYMMDDIADEVSEKIPYDEVNFMGEWTSEKSFVLLVTVMKMARLGYLPSIDLKDI